MSNIARIEFPDGVTILPGTMGLGWIFGDGAPASSLGRNGERYVDDLTGFVWNKANGVWMNTGAPPFATAAAQDAAEQAAEDRQQTAQDREATRQDRIATGADREETGLDRAATKADRAQTSIDRAATLADRIQTWKDRTATGIDHAGTKADREAVAADLIAAQTLVSAFEQVTSIRPRLAVRWETAGNVRGIVDLTGPDDGSPGSVFGPDETDYDGDGAGTHTDPVTGTTVPNTGLYAWVAAASAWTWAGPNPPAIEAAFEERFQTLDIPGWTWLLAVKDEDGELRALMGTRFAKPGIIDFRIGDITEDLSSTDEDAIAGVARDKFITPANLGAVVGRWFKSIDIPKWAWLECVIDEDGELRALRGARKDVPGKIIDLIADNASAAGDDTIIVPRFSYLEVVKDRDGDFRAIRGTHEKHGFLNFAPAPAVETSPPQSWPTRPNSGNAIEGTIHNQWITLCRQSGENVYIGGIGEAGLVPAKNDVPIVVSEILFRANASESTFLGMSHLWDDHDAPSILTDVRHHANAGWSDSTPVGHVLDVFQRQHGGSGRAIKHWRGGTYSAADLGPRGKLLAGYGNLTYGQVFRRQDNPDEVWSLMRSADVAPRTWGIARSFQNLEDGVPSFVNIWESDDNLYSLWWPLRDGSGGVFAFHTHPANSGDRRIVMAFMTWDGVIWSYSAIEAEIPIVANPFNGDEAPDPYSFGDTIFTPGGSDRIRLCDMKEVADGILQVVYVRWTGSPAVADFSTATIEYVKVDLTGSSPVVSTPVVVAPAGTGYFLRPNAYLGLACVVREDVVAVCKITHDGSEDLVDSRFAIWDCTGTPTKIAFAFGTDVNGDDNIITEYVTTTRKAGRPVLAIKDDWDGVSFKYTLGDVIVFAEAEQYVDYSGPYKSRQRWVRVLSTIL
ncbi:hypothetical protein [Aquibium oceanicum]|uniref:Uncharacterized protein n=1 Tax=Aquibium oceanicum TaxID=1670800 RepID=A0A1L3SQ15_9HYPH|nr:hypothetical protein [Aquibium oceanicum]APH71460.1 hypothetical protein BSQ44_08825 [Aquibium oceanicum]